MMWISALFVGGTIAQWIIFKPKHKPQDWIVQVVLLALAVVMSFLVVTDRWAEVDPLWPLKVVFMPLSQWLYNHV